MEILDELPKRVSGDGVRYDYSGVDQNPGKWVSMPDVPKKVAYSVAKYHGYECAVRGGTAYMRKPIEGEGKR